MRSSEKIVSSERSWHAPRFGECSPRSYRFLGIACISHHLSAATGNLQQPAPFAPIGLLDVRSRATPRPSGRKHTTSHCSSPVSRGTLVRNPGQPFLRGRESTPTTRHVPSNHTSQNDHTKRSANAVGKIHREDRLRVIALSARSPSAIVLVMATWMSVAKTRNVEPRRK